MVRISFVLLLAAGLASLAIAAVEPPGQPGLAWPNPSGPRYQPRRQWQRVTAADPLVQSLVDQIEWTPLSIKIQALQDFGTRHTYTPQCDAAAESLRTFFADLGLATEFFEFPISTYIKKDVVATKLGHDFPDSIFVICGHYDSTSESWQTEAPGADDNGSGTAAVMTAAELMAPHSYRYTVKYICFSGEEQGLVGSSAWTTWASSQGLAIVGALNFDMIGYWAAGVDFDLEIESNDDSLWLLAAVTNAADLYTSMPYEIHVNNGAWWGDHASFWDQGYAAINHEEAYDWYDPDFNPFYHTYRDKIRWLDPDFTVGNTKIAVAALATLAGPLPDSGIGVDDLQAPRRFDLTAHPNPFNGRVTFSITAPEGSASTELAVYDARGRWVALLPVRLEGGRGAVDWDARDAGGAEVASGAYFARLADPARAAPLKILYVK